MKALPDGWLRVAGAAGAGAVWGLGLARLVAEAGFCPTLYGSVLAVAALSALCALAVLLLALHSSSSSFARFSFAHFSFVHLSFSNLSFPHLSFVIPLILPVLYVVGVVSGPLAGGVLLVGGAVLALLVALGGWNRWMPPAALGLAAFGLYLRTLLPSLGLADTFEFQVVVPRLAVAHPTGYPLYVLLGKLFTLLPFGNMAWRVNLASAAFASGTVLVLYKLVRRLAAPGRVAAGSGRMTQHVVRWLPALVAALSLAFSSTFWSQAVVAEVYALHNLFVAAILYFLLGASSDSRPPAPRLSLSRRWQVIGFLVGLGLTNHLTTALLLPAVALALVWDRPRLRLKDWLVAAGLGLLGFSVYLFIPLRWPALNHGEVMTLRQFVTYITGGQFHAALRLDGWRDPVRWGIVGRMLREPFGWAGLALAASGVTWLAIGRRRALALTGVTFLAFVLYGLDYYVPDISVFLLPAHVILAIWIGAGLLALTTLVSRLHPWATAPRPPSPVFHLSFVICHLSLFVFPLRLIWLNLPIVDMSHDPGDLAWGQYVLNLPLAPGSAVLADVEKFAPLYYLQQIEGLRPDLDVLLFGSEELYQAELAARMGAGQTVYLARYLPDLVGFHLHSVGPLVAVENTTPAKNWVSEEVIARFGDAVQLLDADLSADPLDPAVFHLALTWEAQTRVNGDFLVQLRVVDGGGRVRWESDGARPVGGLYPTNAWPAKRPVTDYHEVRLPSWLPRGEYALEVGLFPPFGDTGLDVDGGGTAWLALDTLEVVPPVGPLPPLAHRQRFAFAGGAWLTGYNLAGEVPAGAPLVVDLSWHGVEGDAAVRLAWADLRGPGEPAQAAREDEAPVAALASGMLRSRHVITAPQAPGDYVLSAGLMGESARCGWLAPLANDCPLATVEVVPAQQGLANFADALILLGADVALADRAGLWPGEAIPIVLRWQALRALDEDYTVFVHLIGPDGRLHGQVDMWPVQGSYPTSRWTPGEEVTDPYDVRLEPDAPPGTYRIEVGWYLLATMQRLPVVDARGRPVGDSTVVGSFSVVE